MSISTSPPPVHVFLDRSRVEILDAATQALARAHVPRYDALAPAESRERLEELFDHVRAAAATRHASTVLEYARSLAAERFAAGYDLAEVQTAINLLEEATWKAAFANLGPDRCLETLGLVSTIHGGIKDALAREYVLLATGRRHPTPRVQALFAGTDGP